MTAAALTGALLGLLLTAPPALAAGTAPQATWHAEQASVPEARSAGRSGEGVVVAVLDSWVDAAHRDFEGRVLAGADCSAGRCVAGPATSDACDHGTHVAGTVASSSYGVAPRAQVLPVRVLRHDAGTGECTGRPDDVAAGIRWAVAAGARVINLSLGPDVPGLSASSAIPAATREAAAAGAVVVFSAGNAGLPVADSYGGSALIVAATGPDGTLASYSQRGVGVDLAAPGGDPRSADTCTQQDCVTSLFPGNRYAVAAGTSMAAPHVAGVAALVLGQDPSRTAAQVVELLERTARPLRDAGRGLVDATAALGTAAAPPPAAAQTTQPPAPLPPSPAPAPPSPSPQPEAVVPAPAPDLLTPLPAEPTPVPAPVETPPRPVAVPAAPAPAVPTALAALAAALVVAGAVGSGTALLGRGRR